MAQDSKAKKKTDGETAAAPTQQDQKSKKKTEAVVYVGPNLAGSLPLRQFTVFRGGMPPHVSAAMKDDDDLRQLFVPVAELSAARDQLKNNGSRLARAHGETLRKHLASRRVK